MIIMRTPILPWILSLTIFWMFPLPTLAANESLTVATLLEGLEAGEVNPNPLFQTTPERRVTFANIERFAPTRRLVSGGTNPFELKDAPVDLGAVTIAVDDSFGAREFTLHEFLSRHELMGFMIVQGDDVLVEHYAPDHGPDKRWVSFSVTKSVSSMLIGAAIHEGYINSVDDLITDYLPRLRQSAYATVTLRHLLHMSSGVAWNEDYADPASDVAIAGAINGIALTEHLAKLPREAEPGTRFNYNTGEANLVGEVLRAAIANGASAYISSRIWQAMGADAYWLLDEPNGRETGGCCIAATVRDYARLGLLALNDGVLPDGRRVLPEGWMTLSTTPSPALPGYGLMWWLTGDGRFHASGIFGQKIFVDPATETVIAVHSNATEAVGVPYSADLQATLLAVTDYLRTQARGN